MPIAYPYKMSDWYGYDHDCSLLISFLTVGISRNPCNSSSSDRTFYHDGSGLYPAVGDIVYDNNNSGGEVSGGNRRWFFANGNGGGTYNVQFAQPGGSNSGLVTSVGICF